MSTWMKWPLVLLVLYASQAGAGTVTGTLNVSATVNAACAVSTSPVAFGIIVSSTTNSATGTITVTCTNGTNYTIALGDGNYYSSGRRMQSSATTYEYLPYELYQEVGHTTLWGDGTHGTTVSGAGIGSSQAYTVYGLVPTNQYPKVDSYADAVLVTITY